MARSKRTFYKGCDAYPSNKNTTVRNYIKGEYFDRKLGRKVPIQEGANKYNKQFILQLNDINLQFFGLLRADSVMLKLMEMHEQSTYGDRNILYGLMSAQGGTIRYNRILKSALKKYEIRKQEIYDEIKKELNMQEDRITRNKGSINNLMNDFGLDCLREFIEKSTGRNIVDDILQFTIDNNKDTDFRSSAENEEDKKKEIDAYYNALDNEYINYLLTNAETEGINLFEQISDDLKHHHELVQQRNTERKQREAEKKQSDKKDKAISAMNSDNIKLNAAINDNNAIIKAEEWYGEHTKHTYLEGRISIQKAIQLRNLLDELGGIGYYISLSKQTAVKYITSAGRITDSILASVWFTDLEDCEQWIESIQQLDELKGYYIKPQKLCLVGKQAEQKKLTAQVKRELSSGDSNDNDNSGSNNSGLKEEIFKKVVNNKIKQSIFYNLESDTSYKNIILNAYLLDTLKYELRNGLDKLQPLSNYCSEPFVRLVTFYNTSKRDCNGSGSGNGSGNGSGSGRGSVNHSSVRYVGFLSKSGGGRSTYNKITYKDCNGNQINTSARISKDLQGLVALSIIEDTIERTGIGHVGPNSIGGKAGNIKRLEPLLNKKCLDNLAEYETAKSGCGSVGGIWNVLPINMKFNFEEYLTYELSRAEYYFGVLLNTLYSESFGLDEYLRCGQIQTEAAHTALRNKLKKLKKDGHQKTYIIMTCGNSVKTVRESQKGELVLDRKASPSLKFFNSYNDAMKAIKSLIEEHDTDLYTVQEIDLTTM